MSILADTQIKQLCTPPTFVIIEKVSQPQDPHHGVYIIPKDVTSFTHMDEKEILAKQKCAYGDTDIIHIRQLTTEEITNFKPMISPFIPEQVRLGPIDYLSPTNLAQKHAAEPIMHYPKIISYGLSSYGYDVRLDRKFKIFTNINSVMIDPLNIDDKCYVDHEGDFCIIPPNSYALGVTMEHFNIPRNVTSVCLGKSTYARCGAIVNVTPIEAGFSGHVVIEIANQTPLPLKVYAGMGIAQFLFFEGSVPCEVSYSDRGGKYQGQSGIQTALV